VSSVEETSKESVNFAFDVLFVTAKVIYAIVVAEDESVEDARSVT